MSAPNLPLLPNPLAAAIRGGAGQQFSQLWAHFDQFILQKILSQNIPTVGNDAVAAGADPTGQKDSTEAMQNILNTTSILYLRAGTYLLSKPLTKTGTGPETVVIYSDSLATIKMAAASNCNAITLSTLTNAVIMGINFQGSLGSQVAISTTNISLTWILRCTFKTWGTNIIGVTPTVMFIAQCYFNPAGVADVNVNFGGFPTVLLTGNFFSSAQLLPATGAFQAWGNVGVDKLEYMWASPMVDVTQSVGQSIASGSPVALSFDTPNINNRSLWTAGSPTQLRAPIPGLYLAIGHVAFGSFVVGQTTQFLIYKNGTYAGYNNGGFDADTRCNVIGLLNLAQNDYIEFRVSQNSGGAETTATNSTRGQLLYIGNV